MRNPKPLFFGALVLSWAALALVVTPTTGSCQVCIAPPPPTLGEQYAQADAALLGRWLSGEMPTGEKPGSTTYEIVQIARAPFKTVKNGKGVNDKAIKKGNHISVGHYRAGKRGDLVLLLGIEPQGEGLVWGVPLEVSAASYNYIVEAPAPEANPGQRACYYLKYLENPDRIVAADAHAQFANVPYQDIVPLAKQFPRTLLRKWLVSTDVPVTRIGLYGLMLGQCGNADDAELMHAKIMEPTQDYRAGIDGIMGGYLLLTGEKGLVEIEKSKFQDKQVVFSETYAAMQALRFLWSHGDGRISGERLKASMRLLLDRPEVVDLVIGDLYRWKDWSVQARLMELYGAQEYNIPCIKRAIIRYIIASAKDTSAGGDAPAGSGEKPPRHVTDGARYLEELRTKDAKLVADTERFFFLQ
jgi:hypothetical protein